MPRWRCSPPSPSVSARSNSVRAMTDHSPTWRSLPTGTVTFLRTDVEGSMRLARLLGSDWDALNAVHLDMIRGAVEAHDGVPVRTEGDAMFAAFGEAGAAVAAAIEAQRALVGPRLARGRRRPRPDGPPHGRGAPRRRRLRRIRRQPGARIAAVGHGEQIVLSETDRELARRTALPAGVPRPRPRAARRSRTSRSRSTCTSSTFPGLRTEFPPLRVARSSDRQPARSPDDVRRAFG